MGITTLGWMVWAGLIPGGAGCGDGGSTRPVFSEQTRRSLRQGEIIGTVSDNGAYAWRGIPYARPGDTAHAACSSVA